MSSHDELWGTFAVDDHLQEHAFVAELDVEQVRKEECRAALRYPVLNDRLRPRRENDLLATPKVKRTFPAGHPAPRDVLQISDQ